MTHPVRLVRRSDSLLPAADGTPLFLRRYECDLPTHERTLVIIHGTGEHGERYERFSRMAAERGWSVIAADLRGHGRSGGTPTHLVRFTQYLNDLDRVLTEVDADPRRTVLVAHSMGGLLGIRYLQTRPERAAGLIALAPLLAMGLHVSMLKLVLGRLCLVVAPQARFHSPIRSWQVTRSQEARRARDGDPLRHSTVTAAWYFQVQEAMRNAWSEAASMTVPLLLLQGERDAVVSPTAPLQWFPRVASRDKSLLTLKDHLHELLTEPDWLHTARLMLDWMDVRVPPDRATIPFAEAHALHSLERRRAG